MGFAKTEGLKFTAPAMQTNLSARLAVQLEQTSNLAQHGDGDSVLPGRHKKTGTLILNIRGRGQLQLAPVRPSMLQVWQGSGPNSQFVPNWRPNQKKAGTATSLIRLKERRHTQFSNAPCWPNSRTCTRILVTYLAVHIPRTVLLLFRRNGRQARRKP